jgi:hypothetical protein
MTSPTLSRLSLTKPVSSCPIRVGTVTDHFAASKRILREHGLKESVLSILTHVNASIPEALGRTSCADIFAAYVTIRIGD